MPASSLLGLVIVAQTGVLYPAYVLAAGNAPEALADQSLAGTIMWLGTDVLTITALGGLMWTWIRAESIRMSRQVPQQIGR